VSTVRLRLTLLYEQTQIAEETHTGKDQGVGISEFALGPHEAIFWRPCARQTMVCGSWSTICAFVVSSRLVSIAVCIKLCTNFTCN
jgi:hypothetical protein